MYCYQKYFFYFKVFQIETAHMINNGNCNFKDDK